MLLITFCVWLLIYRAWGWFGQDAYAATPSQSFPTVIFSALIALLAVPILVVVVIGDCYTLSGHGEGRETLHVWLHCVPHLGMLVAAVINVGLLLRHARSPGPLPNWLRLLSLGYLSLYAVLLEVALFPINFAWTMPT